MNEERKILASSQAEEKAVEYKYFINIKSNLFTDGNEAYKSLLDELIDRIKEDIFYFRVPPQKKYRDAMYQNYLVILINLIDAYRYDPEMYVAYHRDKNKYKRDKKYKGFQFSYDRVKEFTDYLERYGYIDQKEGYPVWEHSNVSHISKMRCKPKLVSLLDKHVTTKPAYEDFDYDYTHEETVVVKGKKPKPPKKPKYIMYKGKRKKVKLKRKIVQTPSTPAVRQMRENLSKINALMHETDITLDIPAEELRKLNKRMAGSRDTYKQPVDFRRKYLHRVFLDRRFDRGGRFYGAWYQNIPKEYREWISINGVPVVEPDFPSLHPRLLYSIGGHDIPAGDLYLLDGFPEDEDSRDFLKTVLLTAINAADDNSACNGVRGKVQENREKAWAEGTDPPKLPVDNLENDTLIPIINKFREKHHKIGHHFCKGVGSWLQSIDSQITDYVLMHFAERGIACLPMHDSYMIDARYQAELTDIMYRVYTEGLKIDDDKLFWFKLKKDGLSTTAVLRSADAFSKRIEAGEVSPEELAEFEENVEKRRIELNAILKEFGKPPIEFS